MLVAEASLGGLVAEEHAAGDAAGLLSAVIST